MKIKIESFSRPSLLLFAFINMLLCFPCSAAGDTITIAADQWCPYNCEPDSKSPGYGIEIADKIFEDAGHQIQYKILPWTRAIAATKNGAYGAVIGATKEEVPDFIIPEEEIGISRNVFFVRKGDPWRFKGVETLKEIRVGLIRDYSYGETCDYFFAAHKGNADYVGGDEAMELNIKKLLKGRITTFIADPNVLVLTAEKMGCLDEIEEAGEIGKGDKIYIAFSPENPKSEE